MRISGEILGQNSEKRLLINQVIKAAIEPSDWSSYCTKWLKQWLYQVINAVIVPSD